METYLNDLSEFFSTHCVLVANRSFSPHLLKSPLYFYFRPSCSLFSREMYVGQSRRDRINITIHFDILSYCYLLLALTELPTPDGAVGICSSIVNQKQECMFCLEIYQREVPSPFFNSFICLHPSGKFAFPFYSNASILHVKFRYYEKATIFFLNQSISF